MAKVDYRGVKIEVFLLVKLGFVKKTDFIYVVVARHSGELRCGYKLSYFVLFHGLVKVMYRIRKFADVPCKLFNF